MCCDFPKQDVDVFSRGFSTKCPCFIPKHDPPDLTLSFIRQIKKFRLKGPKTPFWPTGLPYNIALKWCLFNIVSLSFSKVKKMFVFAFNVRKLYFGWIYSASKLSILVMVWVLRCCKERCFLLFLKKDFALDKPKLLLSVLLTGMNWASLSKWRRDKKANQGFRLISKEMNSSRQTAISWTHGRCWEGVSEFLPGHLVQHLLPLGFLFLGTHRFLPNCLVHLPKKEVQSLVKQHHLLLFPPSRQDLWRMTYIQ